MPLMASQKHYLGYIYVEVLIFSTVNAYTKPPECVDTKPPECVDLIRRTSRGFHSWCPESTNP